MLGEKDAIATIAVKDLKTAAQFYGETLGLKNEGGDQTAAIMYTSGNTKVLVYQSEFAGSNKATAANWTVGADLKSVVEGLAKKGVKFEHYDMPGVTREGDIHTAGGQKIAWFKDPDGNILALLG
ncbi:MAG TPA: VOC family protein [Candidatus Rubrimentiphilum sp.]|nr:VOC family protein [Candidatus Rubrimentiphilum sp.]